MVQASGSNEYPQSMFWSKNKKNRHTLVLLYKSGVSNTDMFLVNFMYFYYPNFCHNPNKKMTKKVTETKNTLSFDTFSTRIQLTTLRLSLLNIKVNWLQHF